MLTGSRSLLRCGVRHLESVISWRPFLRLRVVPLTVRVVRAGPVQAQLILVGSDARNSALNSQ